ncbi:uncharacterized protein MYCFIDRAFT_196972 [Pseudocercospora fijiensis CIRAD86]|uniref:Uncharacterized protein n=1 Tax=Pseudocercospora fijiensis (strain CIRAD86) TaxID=383855 RepID=M3AAK3_PSEFD|nr:uncharacterized protein MYCFIDRAFT_196972 [Pseudocercospora fijiensis CIRAD86]EME81626.1 hypothetical protein MYCFIDRAFT_196972 [Pseudocercospora fijiensis CIRAD86]
MAINYRVMELEHSMKALTLTDPRFEEVQRRVRALTQELQDSIFDYVLGSFEAGETVIIDEDYRPPTALSINHATRKKLATQYYSNTEFIVNFSGRRNFVTWSSFLWIRSVSPEHLSLIKELKFKHSLITRRQIVKALQQHENVWTSQGFHFGSIRLLAGVLARVVSGGQELKWLDRREIAALPWYVHTSFMSFDVKGLANITQSALRLNYARRISFAGAQEVFAARGRHIKAIARSSHSNSAAITTTLSRPLLSPTYI